MQRRLRTGFTLIELLVVIAIIAILAAILFPVFAQARDKARQAMCMSNAKQISLAVMQYTQDYDEMYPSNHWGIYLVSVQPYMRNKELWRCPSHSGVYTVRPCFWMDSPPRATNCTSIAVEKVITGWISNSDLFGGWDNAVPKSIALAEEPASTVMLAENHLWGAREGAVTQPGTPQTAQMAVSPCRNAQHVKYHVNWNVSPRGVWPTGSGAASDNGTNRLGAHHMFGLNMVYADGHVKWSRHPPDDCRAWVPTLPRGLRMLTIPATTVCRPPGQGVAWCVAN